MPFSIVKFYRVIMPSYGTMRESFISRLVWFSIRFASPSIIRFSLFRFRTLEAAMERSSTISASVKRVKRRSPSKWAAATSFSLASTCWKTHERRLTDVSSPHSDSSYLMGARQRPVSRRLSVLQIRKFLKWIFIDWISISKRRFSANRISRANSWISRRSLTLSSKKKSDGCRHSHLIVVQL